MKIEKNMQIRDKKAFTIFYLSLTLLGLIGALTFLPKGAYDQEIINFANLVDPFIDVLIILVILIAHFKMKDNNKRIFRFLTISSIFLFLTDISFYVAVYIGHLSYAEAINALVFPFLLWISFLITFFSKVIRGYILSKRKLLIFLVIGVILNLFIVGLYFSSPEWKLSFFSFQGVYEVVSATAVLFLFELVIICLIYSDVRSMYFFLVGNVILMSGDFWIKYSYITQKMQMHAFGDLFWLMGLVIICFGIYLMIIDQAFRMEQWFRKADAIKTKIVLWTFGVAIISFFVFFILECLFSIVDKIVFIGLPFFLMIYSSIVIIVSLYMGEVLESPFKKLENNIKSLMLLNDKTKMNNDFYIEEFIALQKFIMDTFQLKDQKDRAEKQLGKIAAQVAHDIRSPLLSLDIVNKRIPSSVDESLRISLRDAINDIRDIINNLDQSSIKNEKTVTQMAVLLEQVLSDRRTAFSERSVTITETIPLEAYGFFADIIPSEIKRVMTNIINNAVEALPAQGGRIDINIEQQKTNIVIAIKDNGMGISEAIVNSLFTRGFTTKTTGSGLGLFHAKETLTQLGGDIEIISAAGKGTCVFLKIPACDRPSWFVESLSVPENSVVICVDDSISIWNAWQERFKESQAKIDLHYCADKEALLLVLAKQTQKPYTYLVDYEFSGEKYTGLDLIEKIIAYKKPEDRIFLVTSRSGEASLQQFCAENSIHMIPKFFALKIPIILFLS